MPRTRVKKLEEKLPPKPGRGRPGAGFNANLKKMMEKQPKNADDEEEDLYDDEVIDLTAAQIKELKAQLEEIKISNRGPPKSKNPEESEEDEEPEPPKAKPKPKSKPKQEPEQPDLKALMKELLAQEREAEKAAKEEEKKAREKVKSQAEKYVQKYANRIRSSLNF